MKELYLDSKQKEILIARAIALLGTGFDEIFFTPPRVFQVFFKDIFYSIFGSAHTIASALFLITSFVANLGYLAKLFNKNEINTLQEVLNNCQKEFGMQFDLTQVDTRFQFEEYFNKDLSAKNKGYLQARIIEGKDGWTYDLKYTLSSKLTAILKSDKTYNQAVAELDEVNDKDIIEFLKKIIPDKKNKRNEKISSLRKKALNKLTASAGDAAKNAADFIVNDVPFQYWLFYFVYDISSDSDDAASWGLGKTIITIGGAIVVSAVKFGGKIVQYFKNKFKAEDKEAKFADKNNNSPIEHKNSFLKHQQLTSFFLDALEKHNACVADSIDAVNGIELKPRKPKNWYKKIISRIYKFFKTKSSAEHIALLQSEIDPNSSSFRRQANSVTQAVTNPMIQSSFFEWVITVATPVFSNAPKVTEFFSSAWSNLVDLGSVAVGGIVGIIYYLVKTKPKLDKEKAALTSEVENAKDTFNLIQELERLSKLLKDAIKAAGFKRPNVANAYDDRVYRRLTTEETKGYTSFKKIINRIAMFIGRVGTGILLVRITALSALKALGIVLSATTLASVMATAFPIITGIAFAVGLIWGAIYLYKYTVDQRLEEAKQFLADKDIRLEAAKKTFHTYKNCVEKLIAGEKIDSKIMNAISSENNSVKAIIHAANLPKELTDSKLPKPAVEYKPSLEKLGLFSSNNKPKLDIQGFSQSSEYSAGDLGPHLEAVY